MAERPPHPAPQIVLGLDTATDACSVALYDASTDKTLASLSEPMRKGHAEALFPLIERALGEAGIGHGDLGRVAVTTGPGTFTGTRVGVSAARGLALARGVPAVGVTVFEVLAAIVLSEDLHAESPIIIIQDARRGELYAQPFDAAGEALEKPRIVAADEGWDFLRAAGEAPQSVRVAGSGAERFSESLDSGAYAPRLIPVRIDGVAVARAAARKPDGKGAPSPFYLRPPDAKLPGGVALPEPGK